MLHIELLLTICMEPIYFSFARDRPWSIKHPTEAGSTYDCVTAARSTYVSSDAASDLIAHILLVIMLFFVGPQPL